MSRRIWTGAAAALIFIVVATANAGGYRYGVSDQSFYLPALAQSLKPSLYPHDTPLLHAQMRLWLGDDLAALVGRGASPDGLPAASAVLYLAGLVGLAAAVTAFTRALGGSGLAVAVALTAATLRHHIARTGANTLEGYFHPRMLAYALGVLALACVLRRRLAAAFLLTGAMALLHPTTALWFGAVVVTAAAWHIDRRLLWPLAAGIGLTAAGLAVFSPRMDAPWLAALAEKDYLFPSAWPAYAWALNLAYPVALWLLYQRRRRLDCLAPGESALIAGLLVLVAGFLVSVPLSAAKIALAVQLQITRVFWVVDAVVVLYLAWWLADDVGRQRSVTWRRALVGLLAAFSIGRGYYVTAVEGQRPLAQWTLPANDWTDAMRWLRAQPTGLNVLADPGHAWRYGSSVRLASQQDTVLEQMKDTALAMYDRSVALRVLDRMTHLTGFEDFSREQLLAVGVRYQADVVVLERDRPIDLPVLYRNARFAVYALPR